MTRQMEREYREALRLRALVRRVLKPKDISAALDVVDKVERAMATPEPEPTERANLCYIDRVLYTYPSPIPLHITNRWIKNVQEFDLDYAAPIAAYDLLGEAYHTIPVQYLDDVYEEVIAVMTEENVRIKKEAKRYGNR